MSTEGRNESKCIANGIYNRERLQEILFVRYQIINCYMSGNWDTTACDSIKTVGEAGVLRKG